MYDTSSMKHLVVAALVVAAATGCSSNSVTASTAAPTQVATADAPSARPTPSRVPASSSASSPTPDMTTATSSSSNGAEAVGEKLGGKIAFYAAAKAAGVDDSTKMDELARGICDRIESGKPATVGPWMKDAFHLRGDVAAKVAVVAILSECPKFKSLVGG